METLQQFEVKWKRLTLPPTTDVVALLLEKMCKHAAGVVKLQCGREYGFSDPSTQPRGTDLTELSPEQLQDLATSNVICEQDLSHFSHFASVAKFRNHRFKAKQIRTNCTLYRATTVTTNSKTCHLNKKLRTREDAWTCHQKELLKEKIDDKKMERLKQNAYVNKLLLSCKSWNGPVTSVEELNRVLALHQDVEKHIVQTELKYYKHTHKSDIIARRDLFRIYIPYNKQYENLCELLEDVTHDSTNIHTEHLLPSNEEALKILQGEPEITQQTSPTILPSLNINELCITVWEGGWYLGCIIEINQNTINVDHLERVQENCDLL